MTVLDSFRQMPGSGHALESIVQIDAEVERQVASHLMNQTVIEACWSRARRLGGDCPGNWLLLIRMAEAALLCAGNYADSCEYEAAGDLLVNPREIVVHSRGDGGTTTKNRHGRLSAQFGLDGADRLRSMKRFSAGIRLEITRPPLLPHMEQVLKESGCISQSFIQRLEAGQRRVADTLACLAAWRVFDSAELWRRQQASSTRDSLFVDSHLCRFDTRVFHQIGEDLRRSLTDPRYRSPFLIEPYARGNELKSALSATALTLAASPA